MQISLTLFFNYLFHLIKNWEHLANYKGSWQVNKYAQGEENLREKKDSSPIVFFSFFLQIVLFIVSLFKSFDCKIMKCSAFINLGFFI